MSSAAIIPVAGYGVFTPGVPKAITPVMGRPMIEWIVEKVLNISLFDPVCIIINPLYGDIIRDTLSCFPGLVYATQPDRYGTGDAIERGLDVLPEHIKEVFIHFCDMPLITGETIRSLHRHYYVDGADVTMMLLPYIPGTDPAEFGRVIWKDGQIHSTIEPQDIKLGMVIEADYVNPSVYMMGVRFLKNALPLINPIRKDEFAPERRLQDVIRLVGQQIVPGFISHIVSDDLEEFLGANTHEQFQRVHREFERRANNNRVMDAEYYPSEIAAS